jgi:hypothetical protein
MNLLRTIGLTVGIAGSLSVAASTKAHADESVAPASSSEPIAGAAVSTGGPPTGDAATVAPSAGVSPTGGTGADAPSAGSPAPRSVRFTGTIGAISLPRLLSLELFARFRNASDPRWDLFALGAGIEYLPPGVANFGEQTTLSWFQVGPEGRFFPYRWLFVGARIGWQFARADSEKFGSEVDYTTTSAFVAPKVGALYTFASGFTIGGDLGATIPLFAGTSLESDGQSDSNARKAAKTFGMFVMPFVSLRVGWTI